MNQSAPIARPGEASSGTPASRPGAAVDSTTLMAGKRELLIRHGDDTYRLRITASNKLILTK